MTSLELNPSQHVERIREILIGRDLHNMHGRLSRLEGSLENKVPHPPSTQIEEAIASLKQDQAAIRQELQIQKKQNSQNLNSPTLNGSGHHSHQHLASEMASQIDARFREILSHLQNELLQLKGQLDDELRSLKVEKADRSELQNRFARLASAAADQLDHQHKELTEGYLL